MDGLLRHPINEGATPNMDSLADREFGFLAPMCRHRSARLVVRH